MKKDLLKWLHHYISPAFLIMLTASFVLWYIAKLSYTYTTDLDIDIKVAGAKFEINCVVEGVGTNLFGYRLYKGRKVSIPLSELKYEHLTVDEDIEGEQPTSKIIVDAQSLQNAISVRYSDIKVISIGSIPTVEISKEKEEKFATR